MSILMLSREYASNIIGGRVTSHLDPTVDLGQGLDRHRRWTFRN